MSDKRVQHTENEDPEQRSVKVIHPNLSLKEAIQRVSPDDDISTDNIRTVGYPKFLFDYHCSLDRKFFSDRDVSISITVNAITGGRLRNDEYPGFEQRSVSTDALLRPRLSREEALERSRSVLRKYLSFHYSTYILISGMPETEVLEEELAYALYWLVPNHKSADSADEVSIVNSISGEIIEENAELDQIENLEFP